jgi:AraC family transcriptional regulator of adaptative response/methylated-DNA-[protein]-cysteine methyltransferase
MNDDPENKMPAASEARLVRSAPAAPDPRWMAVVNRDPRCDGQFVYGVRTTGVYCRPICPSRLAKPANVSFYSTCGEAEKAGFRACRRCRPNGRSMAAEHVAVITKACRKIEQSEELPCLASLADAIGMSSSHFHRTFKALTGITPRAYGAAHRAQRLRNALSERKGSVTEAIYGAGFNSNSRFYETANEVLGMTPTAFRDGGTDATVMFAAAECRLGSVLVACSVKGVCAILLGDYPHRLIRTLRNRFPKARLVSGDPEFERLVANVIGFVEIPAAGLDLPRDVRGTALQQRVWEVLRQISASQAANDTEIGSARQKRPAG